MKKNRKIKFNLFHLIMFASACFALGVLIHDFIFWGVMPLFTGETICLTYFGFFVDLLAILIIDLTIQCIRES